MYEYRAHVVNVVDGDTLHLDVDLGCDTHILMTVRLYEVNAPEHGTPEGDAATEYVRNWIHNHGGLDGLVMLDTVKDHREKYGRYLGVVRGWNEDTPSELRPGLEADRVLNMMLFDEGHAVAYDGGKR